MEEKTQEKVMIEDSQINHIANMVMANLKIYIDERFDEIRNLFIDFESSKLNIATLSTLLATKKLFTLEEFRDCFKEMEISFGKVDLNGRMSGKVIITDYNFGR